MLGCQVWSIVININFETGAMLFLKLLMGRQIYQNKILLLFIKYALDYIAGQRSLSS